jgi:hypothetical protein
MSSHGAVKIFGEDTQDSSKVTSEYACCQEKFIFIITCRKQLWRKTRIARNIKEHEEVMQKAYYDERENKTVLRK